MFYASSTPLESQSAFNHVVRLSAGPDQSVCLLFEDAEDGSRGCGNTFPAL